MMLIQLATSDNCPYQITDLQGMGTEELFEVRNKINYLDAMQVATKLDYQAEAETNRKPPGR